MSPSHPSGPSPSSPQLPNHISPLAGNWLPPGGVISARSRLRGQEDNIGSEGDFSSNLIESFYRCNRNLIFLQSWPHQWLAPYCAKLLERCMQLLRAICAVDRRYWIGAKPEKGQQTTIFSGRRSPSECQRTLPLSGSKPAGRNWKTSALCAKRTTGEKGGMCRTQGSFLVE